MDEIISFVDGLDGVLTLRPAPGDGTPEISWGTRSSTTRRTGSPRRAPSRSRRW
ncbi:hypothetical protein ACFQ0M_43045 [Kitasatospora aburaviensis]